MEVKVGVYTTPRPKGRDGKEQQHARIKSKGTRRLNEMCDELMPLGLNSAQIKGVLDGVSRYVARSLKEGYRVELDGLGIFSLSVSSLTEANEPAEQVAEIVVDGVNFKCGKQLKDRVSNAKFMVTKEKKYSYTEAERRQRMQDYLSKHGSFSRAKYALLNACSCYQADKDIQQFIHEGIIIASGLKTHKVYLFAAK